MSATALSQLSGPGCSTGPRVFSAASAPNAQNDLAGNAGATLGVSVGDLIVVGNTLYVVLTNAAGTATFTSFTATGAGQPATAITANGAVGPHASGQYAITKAGVAALTLAAPTATTDDGVTITLFSTTANAHTLTATGILNNGSTSVNVATFAAHPGASITLVAYQAAWYVIAQVNITFS